MKQVDVFGPYTGPTGYDQVVRGFITRLSKMGVNVNLENFTNWSGFNYFENPELKAMERPHGGAQIMMNFCLPPQARYLPHEFNVLYSMFEADKINEQWREAAAAMDLVIVPCQSSYDAFRAGGVRTTALRKVPLGIDTNVFNDQIEPMQLIDANFANLINQYPIRVMNMQELGPRKNIEGLVRAWLNATSSGTMKKSSCLILKISAYSAGRYHRFMETLEEIRRELGLTKDDHAPIFINCKLFQYEEIPSYMAAATHYISVSRGEGWDLPAMQAAALGKILIVPKHSSYMEWADSPLVKLLKDNEETLAAAEGPLREIYANAKWMQPSTDEITEVIKSLSDNLFDDVERAKQFGEKIRENYSWESVAKQLHDVLDEEAWSHTPGEPKHDLAEAYDERQEEPSISHWTQNLGKPCGIANYTSDLCNAMSKEYPHVLAFGGDIRAHDMMCSFNHYKVENIQFEYQFADHRRLAYMLQFLRERGVKSVVTMHTFNESAHMQNRVVFKYADSIIVHSEQVKQKMKDEWYPVEKVKVMPMPVPPMLTEEEIKDVPRLKIEKTKPIIAFYGFLYFHKGAEKLVRAFAEMKKRGVDAMLLMMASKPQNTQDDVAGRVQQIIEEYGLVGGKDFIWISDYVADEKEVISTLMQADLIVLPYDHYGSFGTSAAIGTCLAAGKPVTVTDVCWFSHVPDRVATRLQSNIQFTRALENQLDAATDPNLSLAWSENVKNFVNKNQVGNVAKEHIEFYKELTGFGFEGGDGNSTEG
jgi:glycosyltransferase involved in cell wall biosynthesis